MVYSGSIQSSAKNICGVVLIMCLHFLNKDSLLPFFHEKPFTSNKKGTTFHCKVLCGAQNGFLWHHCENSLKEPLFLRVYLNCMCFTVTQIAVMLSIELNLKYSLKSLSFEWTVFFVHENVFILCISHKCPVMKWLHLILFLRSCRKVTDKLWFS